jgi:hypothetical protein
VLYTTVSKNVDAKCTNAAYRLLDPCTSLRLLPGPDFNTFEVGRLR